MHQAPSPAPLALPTALLVAALLATAHGKSLVPEPSTDNAGEKEACGNPEVSLPPFCLTCRDIDNNLFFSSVASDCHVGIRSYNGNGHRAITDLSIAGSVGAMPLEFTRYSNTRLSTRNLAHSAFGPESPWSHNYEWVMRDAGGTVDRPIVKLTYPNGAEKCYQRFSATGTSWFATRSGNPDRIINSGDDFVLYRGDLTQYHFKKRYHSVTNGVFYRIEAIKDAAGNTTTISYLDNDDTLIRQATDPAGNWIKLHYQDISIRANNSTTLARQLLPTGSTNIWKEINLTPGESFRYLALYQGNSWRQQTPLRVAELEFYDENNVKITGTPFGSWPYTGSNYAGKAFDANNSTYYQYKYEKADFVGLQLQKFPGTMQ